MKYERIWSTGCDDAGKKLFEHIRTYRDKKVIYFNGWRGFWAAPVVRSIPRELPPTKAKESPPELCYDTKICIDCSVWESRRVMQRKIAEELKLSHETMAMFDKNDEEDDFNGVDRSSRDVIRSVSEVIGQNLGHRKLLVSFLNGSDDEVDISRFGVSPNSLDHVIVWTFRKQLLTIHSRKIEIAGKLRYTELFVTEEGNGRYILPFSAMLNEEAASIIARHPCMQGIDPTMVADCCLYELVLHYSFHSNTGFDWVAHASNFWMCDGITKGDISREISYKLHQEICWECDPYMLEGVFNRCMRDLATQFLVIKDDIVYEERPYRWIFIISKKLPVRDYMRTILESASSLFIALERSNSNDPQVLPNGLLENCSNLCVLLLCCCSFSFVSPPFLLCQQLRFLGLDHCQEDKTSGGGGENNTVWACLCRLWVLDLRHTEWGDILSEEKMDLMANLRELNIEGVSCWQYTYILQGRLPCLQRLRIIKPTHRAETSIDNNSSFMGKAKLEIVDFSGNKDMKNIPTSLSTVNSLQVLILDGCDGLENVLFDGPSLLRSFSFDGYGPATRSSSMIDLPSESTRPSCPSNGSNNDEKVKTSKISLQGCTHLDSLFIRGLPNLVELDLSGSAIKILDLKTMVVNVPELKRLFLLGCEYLRAINWGPRDSIRSMKLQLLCIDTRPGKAPGSGFTWPWLSQDESLCLQVHAILADARLVRSLWPLVSGSKHERGYRNCHFNIHITSSIKYAGIDQHEAPRKDMVDPSNEWHDVLARRYGDVLAEPGVAPLVAFPEPPSQRSNNHIELGDESYGLESELVRSDSLAYLMTEYVQSLHAHDVSCSISMPAGYWYGLKWCRMERCLTMHRVFPPNTYDTKNRLETIWASDLPMAHCIWDRRSSPSKNLRHLHLRSCPRLQFVLPVWVTSSNLETLHVIHCGELRHIFVLNSQHSDTKEIVDHGVAFPKLTTIHLHDLRNLQQISEFKMLAPALKTVKIRGCWSLRRLPTVAAREPGVKRPIIEMEKDVWDALDWDGLTTGHHPDLFEPPVHSRYYRRRRLLRGTVLR